MAQEDIQQILGEIQKINQRLTHLENKIESHRSSNIDTSVAARAIDTRKTSPYASPQTSIPIMAGKDIDKAKMLQGLGKTAPSIPAPDSWEAQAPFVSTPEKDSTSAGSIIGAIGIICLIFGAALIVRMAIDAGWLTPFRQWGLVALLGAVMSLGGFFLKSSDDNEYIGYLSGAGTVVLYFAAYSGSQIFHVYTPEFSVALVALTTFFCLWLQQYFQNDFFGITAAVGTYLAPIILGYSSSNFEVVAAYFCMWTFTFALISAWLGSRTMSLLAAYMGIGIFALINFNRSNTDQLSLVIIVQAIQFVALVSGVVYYSIKNQEPLTSNEVWSFFPPLLFFYATEYYFLNKWAPGAAPWISLTFAGVLLFAHRLAAHNLQQSYDVVSGKMIAGFCAIVFFHSIYLNLLPDFIKPYLVMLIVGAAIFLHKKDESSEGNGPIVLVFGLICIIEFAKICFDLHGTQNAYALLPATGTLLAMFCAYGLVVKDDYKSEATVFLWIIHFLAVLSLYNLTRDTGSLAVSISWAVYAAIILGVSYSTKDVALNKSSIVVLLLAAFKALIYDAANAAPEIRVICLLMTGALLYGAGYLFRQSSNWDN